MSVEVWLNDAFTHLWQGLDPFEAARAVEGVPVRELEQRQTLAFSSGGRRYFIKRHRGVTWKEIAKNLSQLRLPVVSARNEYRAINALRELGIRVPVIAAYGRRGRMPSRLESFLVTEDVGRHESLEDHCRAWGKQAPGFALKRQLILKVADIARMMHGAGICHRDFYLCHFLRMDADEELTLIDLHRALVKSRLGERWIVKDLGGLYFSAMDAGLTTRDVYRFMCRYRQRPLREILRGDAGFWRAVRRRARKLYYKDR